MWAAYKDQMHDLFIANDSVAGYLTGLFQFIYIKSIQLMSLIVILFAGDCMFKSIKLVKTKLSNIHVYYNDIVLKICA